MAYPHTERADALHREMLSAINDAWQKEEANSLSAAAKSAGIARKMLASLRDYIIGHPFTTKQSEIDFFKHVKPRFLSQLIYWQKMYKLALHRPVWSRTLQEQYLLKASERLRRFTIKNQQLIAYWHSGEERFDEAYFTRESLQVSPLCGCDAGDPLYSTPCDHKIACAIAAEQLQQYISAELASLEGAVPTNGPLRWTASKASLVELMYALQTVGAFNDGNVDVKQIAAYFETVFKARLGNFFNTYSEIRLRKKNRTAFLDQAREKLIQRMDEADER